MASPIELKLTRYYDGDAMTDALNGTAITLTASYNPKPGNGADDITESIPIQITGNRATVLSTINGINRFLQDARARAGNGYGDRVYIEARSDSGDAWRRSEIIDGEIEATVMESDSVVWLGAAARTPAMLTITRRGWFENTVGSYLTLTNSNGTASGGTAINVYNCNDGAGTAPTKRNNWVTAASANISGDLPAPVLLWVHSLDVGTEVSNVYCGHTISNYGTITPANYKMEFSGTADANCSGGSYQSVSLTTGSETDMVYGSISTTDFIRQLGGGPFHILIRFRDASSLGNVKFRIEARSGSTGTLWRGPQFLLSNADIIQDFGVINLPPGGVPSDWWNFSIRITGQRTTAATETVNFDFMQLFGGEFARLKMFVPSTTDIYKYGGPNNIIVRWDAGYSTAMFPDVAVYGARSMTVVPGRDNLYEFLVTSPSSVANIVHVLQVYAEYRPRWSSL